MLMPPMSRLERQLIITATPPARQICCFATPDFSLLLFLRIFTPCQRDYDYACAASRRCCYALMSLLRHAFFAAAFTLSCRQLPYACRRYYSTAPPCCALFFEALPDAYYESPSDLCDAAAACHRCRAAMSY